MKIERHTPCGPMCGNRIQLDPQHVRVRARKLLHWTNFTGLLCTGGFSSIPEGVEYELWGFTKPAVVVPRDKVEPAAT